MDIPKNNQVITFIIVSFILGVLIGYIAHQPETVEIIEYKYINTTVEVPKIVERIVEVTVTGTPSPQITTPVAADFSMKVYDPSTDKKPDRNVEFVNWRSNPLTLSIKPGNSILFENLDYSLVSPLTLVVNSTEEKRLSTAGGVYVTFNKKGTYSFEAVIPSDDPSITPRLYGKGTVTIY